MDEDGSEEDPLTSGEAGKRELVREHGQGAPAAPVYVDGSREFERTVAAHDVVVVHYYAGGTWNRRLHAVVETVARETAAAVVKVDVVHHRTVAGEQGVAATPTVDVYAGGDRTDRFEQRVDTDELLAVVRSRLD